MSAVLQDVPHKCFISTVNAMNPENQNECVKEGRAPFSSEELARYEGKVQKMIENGNGEIFLNRSVWHAGIILRQFIKSAKASVKIFCGHLNKEVYGGLKPSFEDAIDRGVAVRVLTAHQDIQAHNVAKFLETSGSFRAMPESNESAPYLTAPHFAIIDGIRYRIETNDGDKSAIVCAYASTKEQLSQVEDLERLFELFWAKSVLRKI